MKVPFVDLVANYRALKSEIDEAVSSTISSCSFILGPQVKAFESDFAEFLGSKHVVGVANGTDAIALGLRALEISEGDEVIIPAHTFVATMIGVLQAGATPVLVDVNPDTYLLDTSLLERSLTKRTKAIIPVHLYGRACDMDALMQFASSHSLKVVEDVAQAHGARWRGRSVGTFGDLGCFSFYPGKNLGAFGDGGAVVTNLDSVADRLRRLRNYGSEIKYEHPQFGTNSRLDSVQAAVLGIKLRHLRDWNSRRWRAAKLYCEKLAQLSPSGVVLPDLVNEEGHVFHLFVVQVEERDKVLARLAELGVSAGIHYPIPFHLQGIGGFLNCGPGSFPVTERLAKRILSLPMFPEITDQQIDYVCESLAKSCKEFS